MELAEKSSPNKKARNVAELTCPARQLKAKIKAATKKPQGCKKQHESQPAKYHNWHTPFCWSQIEIAAKQAGWRMSSYDIIQNLKKMDSNTFTGISHTTVESWIDHKTSAKPRWKDNIVKKILQGNDPGHNKGGK
jgi:hypothetical protein